MNRFVRTGERRYGTPNAWEWKRPSKEEELDSTHRRTSWRKTSVVRGRRGSTGGSFVRRGRGESSSGALVNRKSTSKLILEPTRHREEIMRVAKMSKRKGAKEGSERLRQPGRKRVQDTNDGTLGHVWLMGLKESRVDNLELNVDIPIYIHR